MACPDRTFRLPVDAAGPVVGGGEGSVLSLDDVLQKGAIEGTVMLRHARSRD
jgi:hypothetical protein